MNINELPEEILSRILSFLPRSDRLESALTCRRWAQTVARAPPLLRDIWLVIEAHRGEEAETVFANSQRQYENLRFEAFFGDYNATFWSNIGSTLRKLKIIPCDHSFEALYSILHACSNLESLTIYESHYGHMCRPHTYHLSELPHGIYLERIQKSMRNMRHLHLDFIVTADILESLLVLMPNVSSIAVALYERESDTPSRLENILGTSRKVTRLGSDGIYINEDDCEPLLSISSASLRVLRYGAEILAPTVLDAIGKCSMLRDLHLWLRRSNDTGLLQNILRNVPELESFSFSNSGTESIFRREDLMPIFELRKLRHLFLSVKLVTDSNTCIPDEIVSDLSRMISLESLRPGYALGTVDSTRFRILASMPNLRELKIPNLRWHAECLETILFGLGRKLKTLTIEDHHSRYDSAVMLDRHSEVNQNTSALPDRFRSDRQGDQKFSSLEVLVIREIPLSDACVSRIAAHHCRLKIVSFLECYNITDAGLVTLFEHEPLLEELTVFSWENLDGTFLEALGELCRRLRSLTIRVYPFNDFICKVEEFRLRRPRIKCKDLSG